MTANLCNNHKTKTHAPAGAEGQVSAAMARLGFVRREAVGVESVGRVPEFSREDAKPTQKNACRSRQILQRRNPRQAKTARISIGSATPMSAPACPVGAGPINSSSACVNFGIAA